MASRQAVRPDTDDDIDAMSEDVGAAPFHNKIQNLDRAMRAEEVHERKLLAGQCTAYRRDGRRCDRQSELGSMVCKFHGGGTPIARAYAKKRLMMCVGPALDTLAEAMQHADWPIAVKAAQIILDRAGLGPHATLELKDQTDDLERLDDKALEHRALQLATMIRERSTHQKTIDINAITDHVLEEVGENQPPAAVVDDEDDEARD